MSQSHKIMLHKIMSHDGSHDECEKVVHRPGSKCISSIQGLNKDSIEFFLSTWIRSKIQCLPLSLIMT